MKKYHFEPGDVIKMKSLWTYIATYPIWHYGIVVEDNQVIHFNMNVEVFAMKIIKTDMETFLGAGSQLQKCFMSDVHSDYTPKKIVERAYSVLGTDFGGYDLVTNNCEHFANWCASGDKFSNQVLFSEGNHSFGEKFIENLVDNVVGKPLNSVINTLECIIDFCDEWDL